MQTAAAPRTCAHSPDCTATVKSKGGSYAPGHWTKIAPRDVAGRMVLTDRLQLRCRRCGHPREARRYELAHLRSVRAEQDAATYLCFDCCATVGVDHLRTARAKLFANAGVSSGDAVNQKLVLQDQLATAIEAAGGRDELKRLAQVGRKKGQSEHGRARGTLGRLASKRLRKSEFHLCPKCQQLIQLTPAQLKDPDAHALHGDCWVELQHESDYRAWYKRQRKVAAPLRAMRRRRDPLPLPPRSEGKPPSPDVLRRQFRWTLLHFGLGWSWRKIGAEDGFSHAAVMKGSRSFVTKLLPKRWSVVFGKSSILDEILPIDRLKSMAAWDGS